MVHIQPRTGIHSLAQRKTIFLPNRYYHVYNRGVNRLNIFREKENYLYLLRLVGKYLSEFNISTIAYCLMPNHYHFLLRQNGSSSLSVFIQRTFNAYVKGFNNKYNRKGTLFEGPFRSLDVDDDSYLIHLCRYIHRNPFESNPPIVKNLSEWPFSNYPEWIGLRNGSLVDRQFIREFFPENDYRQFCEGSDCYRKPVNLDFFLFGE